MLLKRIEKNGEVKALYESSNILASSYKEATKELTLTFKHGGQYKYADVSESDYFRFEMADSQGKVFNTNIKSKTTETLEKVDPKTVEKEIESFREDEVDSFKKGIVGEMKALINIYDESGELADLKSLTAIIKRYEEALSTKPTANA